MNPLKLPTFAEQETIAALGHYLERSLNFRPNPAGRIIPDGLQIGLLATLDRFARLALETNLAPFRISWEPVSGRDVTGWNQRVRRQHYIKIAAPNSSCRATEELARIMRQFRSSSTIFISSDQVANQLLHAPHIRLLLDVFFSHPISINLGNTISMRVDGTDRIRADVYNDFVTHVRRAMRDRKSLSHEWHNWNLGSRENVANLSGYLDHLFAKQGNLSVLHLRLFHARERANLITSPPETQHQDLHMLRACRAKFFDRMRRKPALFTDDPNYVWAILPSLEGGYDLHLTLLFSTVALSRVLDDKRVEAEQPGMVLQSHADQVGRYWVDTATSGHGSYLCGDMTPALYGEDWVHGEVCAGDARHKKLEETLGHLAMRRSLVRLKNEPQGEYFGMRERRARRPRRSVRGGGRAR